MAGDCVLFSGVQQAVLDAACSMGCNQTASAIDKAAMRLYASLHKVTVKTALLTGVITELQCASPSQEGSCA